MYICQGTENIARNAGLSEYALKSTLCVQFLQIFSRLYEATVQKPMQKSFKTRANQEIGQYFLNTLYISASQLYFITFF